ncbi:unnamed protein product [Vitrella brassicaformis CCMP3155]|uniref:Splicing factor 3B subunit 4 n=2 Tax=Vitrella brassicaformis TaxID=1169539 RepID=A0A0G4EH10_VITBC|nr:unnamed protein product [Vitrella brassicaformis CCMP3155]|mmetsp:Transcript_27074/g.77843  ORF Transcript_27074/g.77843 Transcript_27074/m.77843 type:complete len:305 (-) Transcript_27074:1550-2464(-)|eukprot:CEL95005.1 unnamed protein product [Vitrella brassicaformis CCMP3155]
MGSRGVADISQVYERNQEATAYCGNLDPRVDEETLWELFIQCGPVKNVHIPRDKVTGGHSGYGFVEFHSEEDCDYAIKIMNMVKLYTKPLRCNKSAQDKRTQEVGANLFIGNLDPEVDEKLLYDTFSAFGVLLYAKVMRDPESGESKGYGFVAYDAFEYSDAAMQAMNGQFLCNRPVHVSYAYKKDTKGERHGAAAERLIAANRPKDLKIRPPHTMFANVPTAPAPLASAGPPPGLTAPTSTSAASMAGPPPGLAPPGIPPQNFRPPVGMPAPPMAVPTLPPGMPPPPMPFFPPGMPPFAPPAQ